ncbi:MAG: ligase-associated DNA damage response exonuclease [Hydrogenophaga sp.]|uniref:ligase-associated DNA damage response exonuclease n=1 Tax=Hydrogenophaga sp. TaxID=1904254 RepID=UPI001D9CC799|nr:ligase-associated DNA damage response exonuclease [Hydrogenophaga sp.]MBX3609286.1 ligase-associated DNA damage response exonuclease [Hydrogenophaga sp.]
MDGDLIVRRPQGLYCPAGDFFIDPWRRVDRAVITHAHADHARSGHRHYLAADVGAGLLRARVGQGISLQALAYGETVNHNGVQISLHPAGHVLGSAQVRVAHEGRVWVASGDYRTTPDGAVPDRTCAPFEPVRCDVFITESTFGLPIYHWRSDAELFGEINAWWATNAAAGRTSVMHCYSLGKAQRLLAGVDASIGPLVCHHTVEPINAAYRAAGVPLPATCLPGALSDAADWGRALLLCPPSALQSPELAGVRHASTAFASGWMQTRAMRRRGNLDRGFVLSDHADWPGLLAAIAASGAERIIVTHGSEQVLVRHLRELGLRADQFDTAYGDAGEAPE